MTVTSSIYDKFSKRVASHWLWVARFLWLLMALVSLVIFTQGNTIFVENLRETYGANFGLSLQRSQSSELLLIPDIEGQAARVGVMERDVLLSVDGEAVIVNGTSLDDLIGEGAAGTAVTLQIRTGERPLREVTLIRGDRAGEWLSRFGVPVAAVVAVAIGVELLVALGFTAVAAFIFLRGAQTPIVWLCSLVLMLVFAGAGSLPVQNLYFAELNWQYGLDIWFSLIVTALLLFLMLFPGDHFAPRWTVVLLPLSLAWIVAAWFRPDLYFWRLDARLYLPILLVILLAGLVAQLWRYRYVSRPRQRQQTKWVVWGISVALTAVFIQFAAGLLLPYSPLLFDLLINPLTRLAQLIIPVTFALAIFQRRLWEIDVIVNRTLVYAGLSLGIVAIYVLMVGTLGTLFQTQGNVFFALLATGLVAVLFQPVRARLQHAANRLMFGERDDPYAVLSQLGSQLQTTNTPEAMLQSVVDTVATTLKLPYTAVELVGDRGRLGGTHTGRPVAEPAEFPLRYQSEIVGYLVASPRSPGEPFTAREQKLLTDIAAQTGAIAYSVRLTAALQRSREKLVLTREEERRRIRRDLHDELGPTVASQTFALDAALDALENDTPMAAKLLVALKKQNQTIVADIRRLVYELRPPTLDELGLTGALKAYVTKLDGRALPHIIINADPDPLPPLSAAVEVAAYRLTLEAINNVVRHAQAQRCEVNLRVTDKRYPDAPSVGRATLQIVVSDNGIGLQPAGHPGVGLNSMRERAEELGGSLEVVNQGEGVQITAVFPLLFDNDHSSI